MEGISGYSGFGTSGYSGMNGWIQFKNILLIALLEEYLR